MLVIHSFLWANESYTPDTSRLHRLLTETFLHQAPPKNILFARALYEEARKRHDVFYENMGAYYLAGCYDRKHDLDTLTIWLKELERLAPLIGKYDYYLEQKAALSRVQSSKRMIEKAIYTAKEVLKEAEERQSNNGIVAAYNSLACAYSVSKRKEEALAALRKGYAACTPSTKLSLHIDILSRLSSAYGDMDRTDSLFFSLKMMDRLLNKTLAANPETMDNWRDVVVDCQTRYVRYYMRVKDWNRVEEYLEKAKEAMSPLVDSVYWVNIQLMELQYYGRVNEYDKGIALINEVAPIIEKSYTSTFENLISYKSELLRRKGDWDGAIDNLRYLLHKQDSLNVSFSTSQLEQVKDIYHVNELLMERQKITNESYTRAIVVLGVLLFLMALFYVYTKFLSAKTAVAEKAAAEAAALSNADNEAKERLKLEISHDVRTPLNAVVGFAEILANTDGQEDENRLVYNKIIQENAMQLLDYVNNILELSRLESGKMKYAREECGLIDLFRGLIDLAKKDKENHNEISFQTEVKEQIVEADRSRLLMLLGSLIAPATDSEACHINIKVERMEEKRQLLVTVRNTPLAKERFENKTAMIRNEINTHYIHYFGGYYKVDAGADGGPTILFAYPY